MRKLVLAAVAATSVAGVGALTLSPLTFTPRAFAQDAGSPSTTAPMPRSMPGTMPGRAAGSMPGMMHGYGTHPWMAERGGRWMGGPEGRHGMAHRSHTWDLFDRPANLALSPADVTTIAEAILLRHGQHDWKVSDVTPNEDHTVSFAYTTAHGDVIARFTMDTRTGRITRSD